MHPETARPLAALLALALLGGCAGQLTHRSSGSGSGSGSADRESKTATTTATTATTSGTSATTEPAPAPPADDLWVRVRNGFTLEGHEQQPGVRQWVQFYASHERHLMNSAERARPFLWHIVESLQSRDMPMELALLPIVESGFDPTALSYASASGLWQFMPTTARRFGLDRDWWYDERRDVLSSTSAALDYLAWLHAEFDDWLLALAAYNAGEGRVRRAMQRNERAGKPTDFWHLDLPSQTENYVPKLLALRRILLEPDAYALNWPSLPNRQLTASVSLPAQVELARAAEMIDLSTSELRAINPGYRRWATRPDGPHALLVPADRADALRTAFDEADPDSLVTWGRHRVARGEALGTIAEHYGTSVAMLKQVNNLRGTLIHPGEHLLIPHSGQSQAPPPTAATAESEPEPVRRHRVRSGESLWTIAQRYDVSVTQLRDWNGLAGNAVLQPGQQLAVRGEAAEAAAETYRVRSGDSLWSIARRLGVDVAALRRWNGLGEDAVLQPGQKLSIRGGDTQRLVYYRVRNGDSLWSIASRFSVDVADIRDWNELGGKSYIQPGQKLRIIVDATS